MNTMRRHPHDYVMLNVTVELKAEMGGSDLTHEHLKAECFLWLRLEEEVREIQSTAVGGGDMTTVVDLLMEGSPEKE